MSLINQLIFYAGLHQERRREGWQQSNNGSQVQQAVQENNGYSEASSVPKEMEETCTCSKNQPLEQLGLQIS